VSQAKQKIDVSPEMVSFVGEGQVTADCWPEDPLSLSFLRIHGDLAPLLYLHDVAAERKTLDSADLVFVVSRASCRRIFGEMPRTSGVWHLPNSLRTLALSIVNCEGRSEARYTLQLARSIELLCQSFAEIARGELIAAEGDFGMSKGDAARIAAARRLIDENWHEKLTLEAIARRCGLNRDKLARGFRNVFGRSVGELLSEKRLDSARSMLLGTDLPISTIAYRCGYQNNASFTRAFSRRFGSAPSQCRIGGLSA
jgi:AraC family transcriptional activator of pyochelin receptor